MEYILVKKYFNYNRIMKTSIRKIIDENLKEKEIDINVCDIVNIQQLKDKKGFLSNILDKNVYIEIQIWMIEQFLYMEKEIYVRYISEILERNIAPNFLMFLGYGKCYNYLKILKEIEQQGYYFKKHNILNIMIIGGLPLEKGIIKNKKLYIQFLYVCMIMEKWGFAHADIKNGLYIYRLKNPISVTYCFDNEHIYSFKTNEILIVRKWGMYSKIGLMKNSIEVKRMLLEVIKDDISQKLNNEEIVLKELDKIKIENEGRDESIKEGNVFAYNEMCKYNLLKENIDIYSKLLIKMFGFKFIKQSDRWNKCLSNPEEAKTCLNNLKNKYPELFLEKLEPKIKGPAAALILDTKQENIIGITTEKGEIEKLESQIPLEEVSTVKKELKKDEHGFEYYEFEKKLLQSRIEQLTKKATSVDSPVVIIKYGPPESGKRACIYKFHEEAQKMGFDNKNHIIADINIETEFLDFYKEITKRPYSYLKFKPAVSYIIENVLNHAIENKKNFEFGISGCFVDKTWIHELIKKMRYYNFKILVVYPLVPEDILLIRNEERSKKIGIKPDSEYIKSCIQNSALNIGKFYTLVDKLIVYDNSKANPCETVLFDCEKTICTSSIENDIKKELKSRFNISLPLPPPLPPRTSNIKEIFSFPVVQTLPTQQESLEIAVKKAPPVKNINALLDQIREGKELRKITQQESKPPPISSLQTILESSLQKRRGSIEGQEEQEEEEWEECKKGFIWNPSLNKCMPVKDISKVLNIE